MTASMTAPMTALRRAGPADVAIVAALEAACFGPDDGGFSPRQLRALLANPNAYWLMNHDGRATACWLRAANGRRAWARLYSLAVHPGERGRGLASALLDAGFRWMRSQGLECCRAEVRADNLPARRLYARHGFDELQALPDYYAPGVPGVRLARRLAHASV